MSKEKSIVNDEERLRRDVEESQHIVIPCTLCNEPTFGRGIFTGEMGALGATGDTFRVIIYPLCIRCSYKIGYKDEVKRKIFSEYN
jgi:hypothetical protein